MLEARSGIGAGMDTVIKVCEFSGRGWEREIGGNLQMSESREMQIGLKKLKQLKKLKKLKKTISLDLKLEHSGPFSYFC